MLRDTDGEVIRQGSRRHNCPSVLCLAYRCYSQGLAFRRVSTCSSSMVVDELTLPE